MFSTGNGSTSTGTISTEKEDATAYNAYFSAAVDLSNAHVSDSGLLTRTSGLSLFSRYLSPTITLPFPHSLFAIISIFVSDSLGPRH